MERSSSKPVIDSIIRSRRKSIALVITPDARLVVRAPYRTSLKYIEGLVEQKRNWIIEKQRAVIARNEAHPPKEVIDAEEFLFLGQKYLLNIFPGKRKVELQPSRLALYCTQNDDKKAILEAWYKKQAKQVFNSRVAFYSKLTGLYPKSVSISGARRRWGSCGPKNTLNFAWRLVMAPIPVIDYVVVHELSHIENKNHSVRFWSKVAQTIPDYKDCRKWLAYNQKLLELL